MSVNFIETTYFIAGYKQVKFIEETKSSGGFNLRKLPLLNILRLFR